MLNQLLHVILIHTLNIYNLIFLLFVTISNCSSFPPYCLFTIMRLNTEDRKADGVPEAPPRVCRRTWPVWSHVACRMSHVADDRRTSLPSVILTRHLDTETCKQHLTNETFPTIRLYCANTNSIIILILKVKNLTFPLENQYIQINASSMIAKLKFTSH